MQSVTWISPEKPKGRVVAMTMPITSVSFCLAFQGHYNREGMLYEIQYPLQKRGFDASLSTARDFIVISDMLR